MINCLISWNFARMCYLDILNIYPYVGEYGITGQIREIKGKYNQITVNKGKCA